MWLCPPCHNYAYCVRGGVTCLVWSRILCRIRSGIVCQIKRRMKRQMECSTMCRMPSSMMRQVQRISSCRSRHATTYLRRTITHRMPRMHIRRTSRSGPVWRVWRMLFTPNLQAGAAWRWITLPRLRSVSSLKWCPLLVRMRRQWHLPLVAEQARSCALQTSPCRGTRKWRDAVLLQRWK